MVTKPANAADESTSRRLAWGESSLAIEKDSAALVDRAANRWAHAPEYLIEAWGLGTFMLAAGFFGTLFEYPGSPVRQVVADAMWRRSLMGLAMGLTALALIYSPWGRRSGAHLNPATTLTFTRLGKMRLRDAIFYMLAQFTGGTVGVLLVLLVLGSAFREAPVLCVATVPGPAGASGAFFAEVVISFLLMTVVLWVSNSASFHRFTGLCVGILVALYITFEAPLSGMSLNPARTLASALFAGHWNALWVYFTAPPLGMLLAAQVYLFLRGRQRVYCAKLDHRTSSRCLFHCGFGNLRTTPKHGVVK